MHPFRECDSATAVTDRAPLAAIVLAAGLGTRMRSARAKVLHELGGRPLLRYPLAAVGSLEPERIVVVVGHQADQVRDAADASGLPGIRAVLQEEQRGTGHAVRCALPALDGFSGDVLILYGDVPLIRPETLRRLVEAHRQQRAHLSLLTVRQADPTGYGRIVRDPDGRVRGIVEERDATAEEKTITEINPGVYCVRRRVAAAAARRVARRQRAARVLPDRHRRPGGAGGSSGDHARERAAGRGGRHQHASGAGRHGDDAERPRPSSAGWPRA